MGATNVTKVFAHWAHSGLTHRELLALVFMANTALDSDTPPVYWRGWRDLANATGSDYEAKPESAKRTSMKILKALAEHGAIVSSGNARKGIRAEYALCLDPSLTYRPSGSGRQVKWIPFPRSSSRVNDLDTLPVNDLDTLPVNDLDTLPVNDLDTPRNNRGELEEKLEENINSISQLTSAPHNETLIDDSKILEDQRQREMRELQEQYFPEGSWS